MSERRIGLDSGLLLKGGQDASANTGSGQSAAPAAADIARFQEALAKASVNVAQVGAPLASPFSLFRASAEGVPTVPLNPAGVDAVVETASALMVSSDGRRAVRVAVDAKVLPGTTVTVEESHGVLLVRFEVTDEAAEVLNREGATMANAIATRLQREVQVEATLISGEAAGYWRGLPA